MQNIIVQINRLLECLAGKKFDAESAAAEIRQLNLLVSRAGCELRDESGIKVRIHTALSAGAKNAPIRVWTMVNGKRSTLVCRTVFPKLTAYPISE